MIQELRLTLFRNYSRAEVRFASGLNFLVGENGSGKTSLLEALYLASHLKSFRVGGPRSFLALSNAKQGRFSIFLRLIKAAKTHSFLLRYESEKALLQWDGRRVKKKQEVLGLIPLMLFTSRDLELGYAAPQRRRLFFDELLSLMKPSYRALLLDYRKLLLSRNRELRLGKRYTVWDQALIEKATLIVKARRAFLFIITPLFKALLTVFFPENYFKAHAALPSFTYRVKKGEHFLIELSHFDYQRCFKAQLKEDVKRGFTAFGPQTDDYHFSFNAQPLTHSASQGEMRLFIYVLKFTLYEYFKKTSRLSPVLLLDDVLTDFDEEKTTRFLHYLKKQKQALLTLANETLAAALVKPTALLRLTRGFTTGVIAPASASIASSGRSSAAKRP